jgi:hypothetical protein
MASPLQESIEEMVRRHKKETKDMEYENRKRIKVT